ncbi:hypothetical protein F0562_024740 [Nyssa sinensis]|uniref:Uncharacterized protein n=1 Tax=Nyssa sinensis TaxID=561372 RepID=A0A5J5BGS7_9ASTE|nr:hypothetical protein F0562_024740 [Nyssa sinensis]
MDILLENPWRLKSRIQLPFKMFQSFYIHTIEHPKLSSRQLNLANCLEIFWMTYPAIMMKGTLICEVRDYRKCTSESGPNVPSADASPIVNKICLRMSLENVVKDIPLISDNTWTYGDLMEVESRILKALQPQLCLDPTPKLDRICDNPVPTKLNLDLRSLRRKRLRQIPEITVTANNNIHGKKVCIDRVPESSNCRLGDSGPISGNIMPQPAHENLSSQNVYRSNMLALKPKSFVPDASVHQLKYQTGAGNPRIMQDQGVGAVLNAQGASAGQDMMISYNENLNPSAASVHGNRENQDGPLSPSSCLNKRARLTPDPGSQQQHLGPHMDSFYASDSLLQQQPITRGIQHANTGMQKYSQQVFDGGSNQEARAMPFNVGQQGMRYAAKEEPVEAERLDKQELNRNKNEMHMVENHMDPQQSRLQQRLPQNAFTRSSFPQIPWNNLGQPIENNSRKEDQFQKRKIVQSPRVSAGGLPQSPLSSKSGEFSSGSMGLQFGVVATSSALGSSQKEKSVVTSVPAVGAASSLISSANDNLQRQHQALFVAKRRSNSLPKTPAMSGVGSPVSVSNMSVPLNASSPSVGTPPLVDQIMLDRFSKIETISMRHQLNCKKNKTDEYPIRKPNTYPAEQLLLHLSSDSNSENLRDETCTMPLSKSLVGGNMNICKIRVLNIVQRERILQGNSFSIVPKARTRMIMSEKPSDGTVAMHYGDIEDGDYLAVEDYLPTLPNTHTADLLAAQLYSMMIREGHHVDDHVQPKPIRMNRSSSSQSNAPGIPHNNAAVEMQQYSEEVSGQPSNEVAKPINSGNAVLNPSQNLSSTRMLPPGNAQAIQISQALLPGVSISARPQQPDPQPSLQQQQHQNQHPLMQQQNPQFQRSPLMLASNPLSHLNTMGQSSNMQSGNHMVNKPSALQLQLLQQQLQQQQQQPQQQQQQQQPQMQRKMMMGLGGLGNNMVGLGGVGNVMGMGAARGMGGTGISAPLGPIPGMGNVGQNPGNLNQASNISNTLSQQLRSGTLTSAQTALMATKLMAQNRGNMLGVGQSSIGGMSGARQMHPGSTGLSMLGHTLNRAMSPMQRTAMGPMGPPKLMPGMNIYMNQQQQQLQLQQQQQLQLQQQQQLQPQQLQQQQQQQLRQQETSSSLQAVVSPPQVGLPSTIGIPQQLNQQSLQQQQQASPQQMSQRTPMSPQLSSGTTHPMSAGNPEACPASPQLSSQTLGSVGSITNSPMELQGVNKSNPVNKA